MKDVNRLRTSEKTYNTICLKRKLYHPLKGLVLCNDEKDFGLWLSENKNILVSKGVSTKGASLEGFF